MKTLVANRNIIVLIFAVMLLIYGGQGISYSEDATLAEFSDTSLAIMVRRTLGLNTQDAVDILKIPKAELIKLTGLSAGRSLLEDLDLPVITDLTGLEHATQLRTLYLRGNKVNDITPLAQLTQLIQIDLWGNRIIDITPLAQLTELRELDLGGPRTGNEIVDITPLAQLTRLTELNLGSNEIVDITPLAQLTELTELNLGSNEISDITPLTELTRLTELNLGGNQISDLAPLTQLTRLTLLLLEVNQIRDLTPLTQLTQLKLLYLSYNQIRDVTPLAKLTESLTELYLNHNQIRDVTPLAQLTYLEKLILNDNQISDVMPLAKLSESLMELNLQSNRISDVSPLTSLVYLEKLSLRDNPIADTFPLRALLDENPNLRIDIKVSEVENEEGGPTVTASTPYPLTAATLNGSVVTLTLSSGAFVFTRSRIRDAMTISGITGITFHWSDIEKVSDTEVRIELTFEGNIDTDTMLIFTVGPGAIEDYNGPALTAEISVTVGADVEYLLSIPTGISLIHVPLQVTAVDGVAKTIESVSDLYDALGGTSAVNFLITYDSQIQEWRSYFVPSDSGGPADVRLADDKGIIVGLRIPVSVRLRGGALGTNGTSTITLNPGLNLVGLPLNNSTIMRVSHLLELNGIKGNVPVIILTDGGEFKLVGRAGDPGDIAIVGGQSFILTAQRAATVSISGVGWSNTSGAAAAPSIAMGGIKVSDVTPILALRGSIVDEDRRLNNTNFRITVKNRSTGRSVATVTGDEHLSCSHTWESEGVGYQLTDVDLETKRAATIGDILEISARSPHPLVGVEPLEYTVTAEDVRQGWIQLPALVAYEIPAETALLHNYPNPFNPETWIPYQLAHAADVTLTIYDTQGVLVRQLDLGYQQAGYYTNRTRAAYWDGRNRLGESVGSGVYFYQLRAGDHSTLRKMVILK